MRNEIYLKTGTGTKESIEINKRFYKKIVLPFTGSPPYSSSGIRGRKKLLETIGYSVVDNNSGLRGTGGFEAYLKKGKQKHDYFSLWRVDSLTKGERAFIGTFNWLTNHEWESKNKNYPKGKKHALGLKLRAGTTPVDFNHFLGLMRHYVGDHLKRSTFLIEKNYDPRLQDNRCFHYQARKEKIKDVGTIIQYMGDGYWQWIECWFLGLKAARKIDPLSKKILMNHKFLGGFFPVGYKDNPNGHPRLLFKNYNNISTIKGSWRVSGAALWEQSTGLHLYTIDIGSAHARFFYWAISSFEKKTKTSGVLLDDNFWDVITNQFLKIMAVGHKLPFKPMRRLFKVGSLALMNGGALESKRNLMPAIKNKQDLQGNPLKWSISLIATYFSHLKSSVEIKAASKMLENRGLVWPMGSTQRYVRTDKPHRVLSAIYCAPEVLALTHLVQISLLKGIDLLPMALEMDGITVCSKEILSEKEMDNLTDVFNVILFTVMGIHLPVKIKSLV